MIAVLPNVSLQRYPQQRKSASAQPLCLFHGQNIKEFLVPTPTKCLNFNYWTRDKMGKEETIYYAQNIIWREALSGSVFLNFGMEMDWKK
jgi:hypothetical protein